MKTAKHEMTYKDKPGYFDNVLINDDFETTYSTFEAILLMHDDETRGDAGHGAADTGAGHRRQGGA